MHKFIGALAVFIAIIAVAQIYSVGSEVIPQIAVYPDAYGKSVETYVSLHISELAPIKEVLGGKFYVTDISTSDGRGTVAYEDGHNAFVADFTYTVYSDVGITITSFSLRGL